MLQFSMSEFILGSQISEKTGDLFTYTMNGCVPMVLSSNDFTAFAIFTMVTSSQLAP